MDVNRAESLRAFLNYVKGENFKEARKLLPQVKLELSSIENLVNIDKRNKLDKIRDCMASVEKGDDRYASAKQVNAENVFRTVIEPFLAEEKRSRRGDQSSGHVGNPVDVKKQDQSHEMAAVYDASVAVQHQGNRPHEQKKYEKVQRVVDKPDVKQMQAIVKEFYELHESDSDSLWLDAHEELLNKNKGMSEEKVCSALVSIVKKSYNLCKEEVDTMIQKLAEGAVKILQGSQPTKSKGKPKGDASLLKYYIQCKKVVITPSIVKKYQNEVTKPYSGHPSVSKFVKKAIELTWGMVTEDPPIFLETRFEKFDFSLHRPLTKRGTYVDYVVWPALLQKTGGTYAVLLKGVVECKQ